MQIPTADLAPIRDLYGRGLYIQALRAADRFGPLTDWSNTAARLLGGRLALQLGAARLGRWLHLRAYRDTPAHPEAIYYHARYRLEKFGPVSAWRFLRSHPDQEWYDAAPEVRADWYGLHAFVCGRLRDFDRADRWLAKAEALAHDRAWLCVERAAVFEFAERYDEALAVARRSRDLVPFFRPGVQAEAHLLQHTGKMRAALDLLVEASAEIESGIVAAHLAALQIDLRHYNDARQSYERYAELSPLMDEETGKWLAARRADSAYFSGDGTAAVGYAKAAGEDFYTAFAERLAAAGNAPFAGPVRLDFPPGATPAPLRNPLDSFPRFWGVAAAPAPADGAPADGLQDPRERLWSVANGFAAAEFTVTPAAAFALVERGLPFLVTMVDAGYSHSQMVVGADRLRHSLWLHEGADGRANETPLGILIDRYAATGPRGLVVVPMAAAGRLAGLDLPDATRYDGLHAVQTALLGHDRPTAQKAAEAMVAADPGHLLTRLARLAIARYDANPTLVLHAVDALLAIAPTDNTFVLAKVNALRELGRKDERTELVRRHLVRKDADPLFAHHYAQALLSDPDRLAEVRRAMARAVRQRPYAPAGYYILGNVLWEEREFQSATDMYRFAAAMEDRDEQFAESYFRAARATGQTADAMRFLTARYERTKGTLAGPARAMFYALSEQDEMAAAFAALEATWAAAGATVGGVAEAGEAMLFAAEMRTNYNEPDAGAALLERARPLAGRASWLRSAARQALVRADLSAARGFWEALLTEEPLAADVHRNLSRAIADLEGRPAAIAWTRAMCARFPHHYPLQQLLIDWLRGESVAAGEPPPAEPVIRGLIVACPEDAWARRELALHLANHGRAAEAFPELEEARRLEPDSPSYYLTLGHALARDDRPADARAAYETAVRRSVENEVAIGELLALARGGEEKKEVLDFVADELRRQRVIGDGLLAYREHAAQAHDAIEPDDVLRTLQEIFDERPDLWQAWSTTVQQLAVCGRDHEAKALAKEAVERYPLLARLWVDLADVCRAQDDREGQIEALRQAVHVAPGWSYAARDLADALDDAELPDDSRVVLEQAVARSPLDPVNHGYLADNLWTAGDASEAVDRLQVALKLDPGYEWAWRHLGAWAERMGEPGRAAAAARAVCQLRPGDPRGWLALARLLTGSGSNDEVLAALDRAIALNPRGLEAYDLKAERLAEMGRYDEAKAAATPAVFEADPPMILQGRAAWVEARRGNLPLACREMRALVMVEPTYYWGWQQLAEWSNESGKSAEFLEATEKLVDLRPDNPIALAMRGEARLQTGDREAGKEDLRDAQHLEPGYSYPGMLLFDAHLQDEEYPQARAALAVLEEHSSGGGRAYVLARYAQLAARNDDADAAVEAFRELLTLPCDSTWPINAAAAAMREAGWSDRVDAVVHATLETAPDFHPWTLMAWLEGPAGMAADPATKLRIVERVATVHPRYAQAYDVMAELLTRLGRYEDAVAACHPVAWGDRPPLILRGRAAWIAAQEGDPDAAVAQMRAVVTADPDYFWGWQQLANWHDEADAAAEYLEATEHLVRLGPTDPSAYGYRGEARAAAGDRRGARADFRRAFEIDPAYAFAGISLFDGLLADGELDEAGRILIRLEEHVGGPHVALRGVRLACARGDRAAARAAFEALARLDDAPPFVASKAAETMAEAGFAADVDECLASSLATDSPPHVARLWVERAAGRGDWAFLDGLADLAARGPGGREAMYAAADALADPAERTRLHDFLRRFGDDLKKTDRGWGKGTAALAAVSDFVAAATWAADWQDRKAAEPWMLRPLAAALRQLGRTIEASAVATAAIAAADDDDPAAPDCRTWLAFEAALSGKTDRAEEWIDEVDDEDLDDVPRVLLALADALILVQRDGRASFEEARADAMKAVAEFAPKQPDADLVLSYRRWSARLAKDAGGLRPWMWAKLQGRRLPG